MITNDGKEILSKFILGQVPSFATHISIGCGANPLDGNDPYPNTVYSKKRLDFEMTRVPISSKGFIDDSQTYLINNKVRASNIATLTTTEYHDISIGETVIVSIGDTAFDGQYTVTAVTTTAPYTFSYSSIGDDVPSAAILAPYGSVIVSRTKVSMTAELPSANRYEITEIGVWSAGSNNLAALYDSRMIFNFSQNWQKHDSEGIISNLPTASFGVESNSNITSSETSFFTLTNDVLFQNSLRKERKEGPRHLNKTVLVKGNFSKIFPAGNDQNWSTSTLKNDWVVDTASSSHIHLNDINFDITGNNASDLLKLAFSVIDKNVTATNVTDVKILLEFIKNETSAESNYAKMQIYVPGTGYLNYDVNTPNTGRYFVASAQLSQNIDYGNYDTLTSTVETLNKPYVRFYTSPSFSPTEIRMCRIYVMVNASGTDNPTDGSADHYIAFDGLRIDNTAENPIYKMCGYSVVRADGTPISKLANTNNYVDFRFSLGVS